jgi:hypothetical protein
MHNGGGGGGQSGSGHHSGGHHESNPLGSGHSSGGVTIGHILGLSHGSGGGGGMFGQLAHALGLGGGGHGTNLLHHGHHGGAQGPPDKSVSWNMAQQTAQNPWQKFLMIKVRFTPALGFLILFVGLALWLKVIYYIRHTEPAENFPKLSNQLYNPQLPTTKYHGQRLPTYSVPVLANQRPIASAGAGFAAEPITGASSDLPMSTYNSQYDQANNYAQVAAPYPAVPSPYISPARSLPVAADAHHPARFRVFTDR